MSIYLLDTDHMSVLERQSFEAQRLETRLSALPQDDVATTIISYEEQSRGWLAVAAQAQTQEAQIAAYGRLKRHLEVYCRIAVVTYGQEASQIYEHLRQQRIRIGTMDLKIAAIALARNATLLTRNERDFGKVPHLKFEDWTV